MFYHYAVRFWGENKRLNMGKIVKYCSSCDEGFAEKFGFCPDCGKQLEAFEMNPLASAAAPAEEITAAPPADRSAG